MEPQHHEEVLIVNGAGLVDSKESVSMYVRNKLDMFRTVRDEVEETWLECWAKYINSPATKKYLEYSTVKHTGDVGTDWRHKLSGGKCYEAVETVVGYLMSATFPNRDWFNVEPVSPGDEDNLKRARLIKRLVTNKLDDAQFKAQWNIFIRQLVITGTSVIALPWRTEEREMKKHVPLGTSVDGLMQDYEVRTEMCTDYDAPGVEVLDVFDCYIDPNCADPNRGDFIRKLRMSKGELIELVKDGTYDCPLDTIVNTNTGNGYLDQSSTRKQFVTDFEGLSTNSWHPTEQIELIEFWGDVHHDNGDCDENMVVTMLNDIVIGYEECTYWCGKPFIIGTYSQTGHSPYGYGGVEPTLGLLHQLDSVTNQRLDNLELAVNSMWTLKSDGVLEPDDVYTEPGRVFQVADHDDLRPMASSGQAWTVTYQEASLLESSIDKVFGTGNYINAGQQRAGERVTATEVAAVRDAGGNRLNIVHNHIESTALIPFLSKVFTLIQQYTTSDQTLRVPGAGAGEYDYYSVSPEDVSTPMKLRPIGSDNVIERKAFIQDRLEFVQTVSSIPQFAEMVDYERVFTDLLQHWGFDEPDGYLVKKQDTSTQAVTPSSVGPDGMPVDPMQAAIAGAPSVADANALQAQASADGGASMMNELYAGTSASPGSTYDPAAADPATIGTDPGIAAVPG